MIELYPFQARGLDEGRTHYRNGAQAVLFVGPTGMGKTVLASAAAVGAIARGSRLVAIAHRRELVDQMASKLRAMGLDVGAFGLGRNAPVQVRSVQALLAGEELPDADFVILDEAHHYAAADWGRVPRAYRAHGARLMGLTATPERDDGRGLGTDAGGLFDALVVVAQVHELVELNATDDTKGITPLEVLEPEEDPRRLAQAPIDAYLERAAGRSAVVFAPNVKTAHVFAEQFNARGVGADVVHGELDLESRDGSLSRFARGDLRVLVNVGVLTEGWDAPICDVAITARKVGSLALLIQMVGRARRARAGKRSALWIDLSGNVSLHFPDRNIDAELLYSLDGIGVQRKCDARMIRPRICRGCKRELPREYKTQAELRGAEGCDHPSRPWCRDGKGEELHCPECGAKISKLVVPSPEEIALIKVERDAARAAAPEDKRTKALTTLYAKGLRKGAERNTAHHAYRGLFKHFPPSDVRARAWREAIAIVAAERGDAWLPDDTKRTA